MTETIHEQIQRLLDEGYEVYSCAIGRIGEVKGVNLGQLPTVTIKSKKNGQKGVTTFLHGDDVKLIWNKTTNRYEVRNERN